MSLIESIIAFDIQSHATLSTLRSVTGIRLFHWITLLGEFSTVVIFALIASIILWRQRDKLSVALLWLVIIGSEGTTFVAKIFFHRPRPINAVFLEGQNSFPSGHATIAIAFYGFLTYLLYKKIKNSLHRSLIIIFALVIIIAIGWSRLYLGVHYSSDVIAGYFVGLLWLSIGISATELYLKKYQK